MFASLLNYSVYSPLEYAFYGLGGALWITIYLIILFQARKKEFVGAPALVMWAFMSWEILWGFFYKTDLGSLFVWGLKCYLPLSGYICWLTLRYGYRQYRSGLLHHYQVLAYVFTLVAWTAFLYFFIPDVDDGAGITSAYLLNVTMSAAYIPMLLRLFEEGGKANLDKVSYPVAWLKVLATACTTVFCLLHMPERRWLHVLCIVTLSLDAVYCYAFYRMRTSDVPRQLLQALRKQKPLAQVAQPAPFAS
jgi:hypothetical protein